MSHLGPPQNRQDPRRSCKALKKIHDLHIICTIAIGYYWIYWLPGFTIFQNGTILDVRNEHAFIAGKSKGKPPSYSNGIKLRLRLRIKLFVGIKTTRILKWSADLK